MGKSLHARGLLSSVRSTLIDRCLVRKEDTVLSACSGGPDSTAMTYALAELASVLGFYLHVVCVDHGLRSEAKDEQKQVAAFANMLGASFHALSVEVGQSSSLQAEARKARYRALQALRIDLERRSPSRVLIATGHTRDDQSETVLSRLLRGAGFRGLSAIAPQRDDGVIRPLIDTTRHQVLRYVEKHSLRTVHDPSNDDTCFERVRIRNQVLPLLCREDSNIGGHLANLADEARHTSEFMEDAAQSVLKKQLDQGEGVSLSRRALREVHPALRPIVLRIWVERCIDATLNRSHLTQLELMLTMKGEVLLPKGWKAYVEDEQLTLAAVHLPTLLR